MDHGFGDEFTSQLYFRDELTDQPSPVGAERGADRRFALAG